MSLKTRTLHSSTRNSTKLLLEIVVVNNSGKHQSHVCVEEIRIDYNSLFSYKLPQYINILFRIPSDTCVLKKIFMIKISPNLSGPAFIVPIFDNWRAKTQ